MSDAADIAADYVDNLIADGLSSIRRDAEAEMKLSEGLSHEDCVDCGAPIPLQRQLATGSPYCISCKEIRERQLSLFNN